PGSTELTNACTASGGKARYMPDVIAVVAPETRALARRQKNPSDPQQDEQQRESEADAPTDELLLDRQERLVVHSFLRFGDLCTHDVDSSAPRSHDPASGGLIPEKNNQEITNPIQMMKPNRSEERRVGK